VIAQLELCEARLDGVFGLHAASFAAAQRAIARYRELNDMLGLAQAQRHVGLGLVFTGRALEGEKVLHEALATFRKSGASTLTGAALESIAVARNALGDSVGARAYFAEALEIFKANGAGRLAAALANNLAEVEFRSGNAEAALRLAGDVLAADLRTVFTHRTGFLMCNMAAYLVALERYDEARSRSREAITMARDRRYEVVVVWALQHLAAVAALRPNADAERRREDRRRAARLLPHTDARLNSLEAMREYTEQQEYDKVSAMLRDTFDEEELDALAKEGRAWSEAQAVAEALLV
jgi:tetratricopeptide (TPR) repeat protein